MHLFYSLSFSTQIHVQTFRPFLYNFPGTEKANRQMKMTSACHYWFSWEQRYVFYSKTFFYSRGPGYLNTWLRYVLVLLHVVWI